MTVTWDPWHTVTVTAVTSVESDEDHDLVWDVTHPEPHQNGCPKQCMTQQAIDEQADTDLPTEPGVYRIRAWGDYTPAGLAVDEDWDGGIEVETDVATPENVEANQTPVLPAINVAVGTPVQIYYELPDPFTGQTSGRRGLCTIVKVDPDYFWARPDRLGRGSIGNEFRFRVDTFEAHNFNYGWRVEAVDAR